MVYSSCILLGVVDDSTGGKRTVNCQANAYAKGSNKCRKSASVYTNVTNKANAKSNLALQVLKNVLCGS